MKCVNIFVHCLTNPVVFAIATLREGSAYVVPLGCGQASRAIAQPLVR
ncbi:hypothetical protein H6G35_24695 [Aulosira sp. FACHB-113]|nr:hypothetical protein [Aulosira sp. FACHB-113]